jgi:hypothetical protein
MFLKGDGHVLALAVSIRSLEHPFYCFALQTELATVPRKSWNCGPSKNSPMPDEQFQHNASGKPTSYEELDSEQAWESFDTQPEPTRKAIEKLAADYPAPLSQPA